MMQSPYSAECADPIGRFFHGDARFCAWRTEPHRRTGKPTKVPYCSANTEAKSNNAHTWLMREQAETLASQGFDGIGIFLGDLPDGRILAGIDLDTCRDPQTGDTAEWAQAVVSRFASYTEISPSLTGLKLFFLIDATDRERALGLVDKGNGERGRQWKQPTSGNHPPAIELYTAGRYFTVTHEHLTGAPKELNAVPFEKLRWLVEEHGPAFCKKDRNAKRETAADPRRGRTAGAPKADDADLKARGEAALARLEAFASKGRKKITAILKGDASFLGDDKSRSAFEFWLVRYCLDAGFSQEEARAAFYAFPHGADGTDERQFKRCWAKACKAQDHPESPAPKGPPYYRSFRGWRMDANGLCKAKADGDDGEYEWWQIAPPFEVLGLTRTQMSDSWGLFLRWRDLDDKEHSWALPFERLHGDGAAVANDLAHRGLVVTPSRAAREALLSYLALCRKIEERLTCVTHTGWAQGPAGPVFAFPERTIGAGGASVVFQSTRTEAHFETKGSLEGWRENVAHPAIGQSRVGFSIAAAFAGSLLKDLNAEGGGFHFVGESSVGKTTLLCTAASVWGRGDIRDGFMRTWRATDNGLEGVAAIHSDTLLVLDEINQADARTVGSIA